jgi:hypothetical protein
LPVMRYSLDRKAHDLIRAELEARALKNQP